MTPRTPPERRPAKLALEDGLVVEGRAAGHPGEAGGELCFNTSMAGHQEVLADPSAAGHIVMMTYPHVGNVGAGPEDEPPAAAALVARDLVEAPSNEHATETFEGWMRRHGLVGITGVDTRRLVRHLRQRGPLRAIVSALDLDDASLVARAQALPGPEGLAPAGQDSGTEPYDVPAAPENGRAEAVRLAVLDFGLRRGLLRALARRGAAVRVFPASVPFEDVLAWEPDGLLLAGGPGDPRAQPEALEAARRAATSGRPVLGVGLGHQLLALAAGLEVFKMKTGHRGANHPVQDLESGRVEITAQNHGFAVREDAIPEGVARISHRNLNDGGVEGLRFVGFPGLSVQYHPEAGERPGILERFLDFVRAHYEARAEA